MRKTTISVLVTTAIAAPTDAAASVGLTGSHMTAKERFSVKNASSVTHYIPAY